MSAVTGIGELGGLEEWLDLGYDRAYRTAYLILRNRADAEEAVQEAFLRAWRFRASLPEGEGAAPWLYRVVVNTCCSKLRSETPHRSRRSSDDVLGLVASRLPGPEEACEGAEVSAALLEALGSLPEHLLVPVVLRYYTGLSEREIATAIRRRPGTVKSRLHEARRRLADDPRLRRVVGTEEGTR
ncbi:MAG: RNA polymerase sigma factor [Acidimicrobiales bacterium]